MKIAAFLLMLAFQASAQTYRVSGTVVDSEGGAPLTRARVVLTGGPTPEQSVVTRANGKFSFDVPRGKYTLLASHHDFGESYGQKPSGTADSSIVVGPDLDTTGILFRWHAPIAIHGKIVDQIGDPVFDAKIELFVETVADGKRHIVSMGRAESDESGNYSWSSLPAGTYYLAATGEPWYYSDPSAKDELMEAGRLTPYALTYFPTGNDARAATPLRLRPGAKAQADFTLRPASGAEVRFTCPDSACTGPISLSAVGIGGAETLVSSTYAALNDVVPGVLPGRYVVRYSDDEQSMRKEIEVAGAGITVQITPKPFPTLTGKIAFEDRENRPRHQLLVNILNEETNQTATVPLGADGSFSFTKLSASHVRLVLSSAEGFFVKHMSVEGAPMHDGIIEIADGASVKVNLTASAETGRLKGFVIDGEKSVPMVMVVLAPAIASSNPNSYFGFQTDSDGSFDFSAVPAGEYVLLAVNNQDFEYTSPETIQPYLKTAKRVLIEPGGTQTERIGLASELQPEP